MHAYTGNILLMPDGRLGLIDYGSCIEMTLPDRSENMHACVCIYICMYMYVYVCMYICITGHVLK